MRPSLIKYISGAISIPGNLSEYPWTLFGCNEELIGFGSFARVEEHVLPCREMCLGTISI